MNNYDKYTQMTINELQNEYIKSQNESKKQILKKIIRNKLILEQQCKLNEKKKISDVISKVGQIIRIIRDSELTGIGIGYRIIGHKS